MIHHLIKDMEQEPAQLNVPDEEARAFAHCFCDHEVEVKRKILQWEGQYSNIVTASVRNALNNIAKHRNGLKAYPQKVLIKIFKIYLGAGVVHILSNLKYLQVAMPWATVKLDNMVPYTSMYYMEWWIDKETGRNMPEFVKVIKSYAHFNVNKLE